MRRNGSWTGRGRLPSPSPARRGRRPSPARCRSTEKISVTLTEMPSASTEVIAGSPSFIAGILMKRFGRSTIFHSSIACATVLSASCANRGSTSIDTRPSTPSDASHCGRSTSQALRTSSVVTVRIVGVDVGAALGQFLDLVVVGVALRKGRLEDRRVGGHADDTFGVDELLQVAALQPIAGQVVEPYRNARGGQRGEVLVLSHASSFSLYQLSNDRSAAAATASGVNPNSRNNVLSSADSP